MRCEQPVGHKGSLKWIQRAVNERPDLLEHALLPSLGPMRSIEWVSPRSDDGYAEYRDAGFLDQIGCGDLKEELAQFWPAGGPQWDALGRAGDQVLLVEAKAHARELKSTCMAESERSNRMIGAALAATRAAVGAAPSANWRTPYYQFANRLAHLSWLRRNGKQAWLVLIDWVGDKESNGPETAAEWDKVYVDVRRELGLPLVFDLERYVIHAPIHVGELEPVPTAR